MAKIINENFQSDYFRVVEGGIKETTELLEHKVELEIITENMDLWHSLIIRVYWINLFGLNQVSNIHLILREN